MLQKLIEIADYNIEGTDVFAWSCFGPDAKFMDFYTQDDKYFSAVYDAKTKEVYYVVTGDAKNNYIWFNPTYKDAYFAEAKMRNIDPLRAYDDLVYTLLEDENDFLAKTYGIVNEVPYDERIVVPIEISDEDFLYLAKQAHEQDITFNKFFEHILTKYMDQL